MENRRQRLFALNLNLAIRPARDLNHSIDDGGVVLVGVERDIVPEGDRVALVQQPDSPVKSVAGTDFAQADGVVVKLAVGGTGVGASGRVGVVAFGGRSGRLWWFEWAKRRSGIHCGCQSGDEESMRCVHGERSE